MKIIHQVIVIQEEAETLIQIAVLSLVQLAIMTMINLNLNRIIASIR